MVLDTTVLLYAVGTEHVFRDPCRRLIAAIESGAVTATTTVAAVQEFTHVRARRRGRADAADLAHAYLDLLTPLLVVDEAALREGLRLFATHTALDSFDAVLAAAATAAGATALVSADGAFASVPAINHVRPDDKGIATLLAA
jgi:uncharacterized protein